MTEKKTIFQILNLFPEAIWDRFAGNNFEGITIFGWVKRIDGNHDFLILEIWQSEIMKCITSSAKYSKQFAERCGLNHTDCKRVEQCWPDTNCINLVNKRDKV